MRFSFENARVERRAQPVWNSYNLVKSTSLFFWLSVSLFESRLCLNHLFCTFEVYCDRWVSLSLASIGGVIVINTNLGVEIKRVMSPKGVKCYVRRTPITTAAAIGVFYDSLRANGVLKY